MQIYNVNIQKLLILYTLAQKKVIIIQILKTCTKFAIFIFFTLNINLHFKYNVYIKNIMKIL